MALLALPRPRHPPLPHSTRQPTPKPPGDARGNVIDSATGDVLAMSILRVREAALVHRVALPSGLPKAAIFIKP